MLPFLRGFGVCLRPVPFRALAGGNCNNGFHDGALYLNVNNAVSNANWNIGAA